MMVLEAARSEMGRAIDGSEAQEVSTSRFYDPWGRPCTLGRWAELNEATTRPELRPAVDVDPADNSWYLLGYDVVGTVHIVTVWRGLSIQFTEVGRPLIFETMVSGGALDEETHHYSTRDAALIGHQGMVRIVRMEQDANS